MAATECYEQIVSRLGELHKHLKRVQSQMLEAYHISLMEYHILIIMMRMQRVSQNDLAAALDVDKALISRQIQSMEQKGLLHGTPDPECRRKKVLSLSVQAQELIPQLQEVHRRSLERIFSDFPEQQLREFQFILEGLVRKL
ncbi:MAG: MarR family transcriptional regulator [Clostridiales bacterium]|nr:MarR family transcriptional regulator [Candidatus Cacconaster stercorequi]